MRVTGGTAKGRRLRAPTGSDVRPTADKVRQALFNILRDRVPGAAFLDLFAGTGGIGIEALSRGAATTVFVDSSRPALQAITRNLAETVLANRAQVLAMDVTAFLQKRSGPYDIVFIDPPYAMEPEPVLRRIGEAGIVKQDGVVVVEHFRKRPVPEQAGGLERFREVRYGDTVLAFYTYRSQESDVRSQE